MSAAAKLQFWFDGERKKNIFANMKKWLWLAAVTFILWACGDSSSGLSTLDEDEVAALCPESARGTFVDERDGHEYHYTTIGNQVWMAEDLAYEKKYYNEDGSELTDLCDSVSCRCFITPFKDRYPSIAFEDSLCPEGWHIPSNDEIDELMENVGGYEIAGHILKSKSGWGNVNPDEESNGTDGCGFNLKPDWTVFSEYDFSGIEKDYYGSFMSNTHIPDSSSYSEDRDGNRYYHDIFYTHMFYSRSDTVARVGETYYLVDRIRCIKD